MTMNEHTVSIDIWRGIAAAVYTPSGVRVVIDDQDAAAVGEAHLATYGSTAKDAKEVHIVIKGGIADIASKPLDIDVEITDND